MVGMNGGGGKDEWAGVKLLDILTHMKPNGAHAHSPFASSCANSVTLTLGEITVGLWMWWP